MLSYWITHDGWYAIKQKKPTRSAPYLPLSSLSLSIYIYIYIHLSLLSFYPSFLFLFSIPLLSLYLSLSPSLCSSLSLSIYIYIYIYIYIPFLLSFYSTSNFLFFKCFRSRLLNWSRIINKQFIIRRITKQKNKNIYGFLFFVLLCFVFFLLFSPFFYSFSLSSAFILFLYFFLSLTIHSVRTKVRATGLLWVKTLNKFTRVPKKLKKPPIFDSVRFPASGFSGKNNASLSQANATWRWSMARHGARYYTSVDAPDSHARLSIKRDQKAGCWVALSDITSIYLSIYREIDRLIDR